ncbi:MAG: glycosyltransferase family protein [Rhodocyclaceae bacterium]
MRHIVICWEFGGGMGHLVPLSLVAAEMKKAGHRVTFVLNDIAKAAAYLAPHDIDWVQAPCIRYRPGKRQLINHADILQMVGYAEVGTLTSLLHAWRSTLKSLQPDQVVCEYAPTAQLAARTLGLPCVCIDNGFSMPPISDPMPPLQLEKPADIARLKASENGVLLNINKVLVGCGTKPLERFSDLYADEVWYRNWVEFNHFGPHSSERHLGQVLGDTGGVAPTWPPGEGPKMFAYVKNDHPFAPDILKAAVAFGFRVLAYLPGRPANVIEELRATGRIIVSDQPVQLSALEDDVQVGIWQSPTGGVGHSLEKGMRMLFLPSQAEQMLACRAVERSGAPARVVAAPASWNKLFEELLEMPNMLFGQRWIPADLPRMAELLAQHPSI